MWKHWLGSETGEGAIAVRRCGTSLRSGKILPKSPPPYQVILCRYIAVLARASTADCKASDGARICNKSLLCCQEPSMLVALQWLIVL